MAVSLQPLYLLVLVVSMLSMIRSFHHQSQITTLRSSIGALSSAIQNRCSSALCASVRPSLDDIERISKGQKAKKRGVGSRAVPHRLNEQERKEWDIAKTRGFVSLRGTGWRDKRGDSPLANIYRNYCDCRNQLCISVKRGIFIDDNNTVGDEVIIDFSPLRKIDVQTEAASILGLLESANKYDSLQSIANNSDIEGLGYEDDDGFEMSVLVAEQPIWRIPVYSITATFTDRKEAKDFAQKAASLSITNDEMQ